MAPAADGHNHASGSLPILVELHILLKSGPQTLANRPDTEMPIRQPYSAPAMISPNVSDTVIRLFTSLCSPICGQQPLSKPT